MIEPHGGILTDGMISGQERDRIVNSSKQWAGLVLNKEEVTDVRNLATGVYSPLKGFLRKEDFEGVVHSMRLQSGVVWPIPIVLSVTEKEAEGIRGEQDIILGDEEHNPLAVLKNTELYTYSKDAFAQNVFGTMDREHPGVAKVYEMGPYLVGGEVVLLEDWREPFADYNRTPAETRAFFEQKGWKAVVAFQTRNVPHRGHEFLQMEALKEADGLLVQPVMGEKKLDDFKDEYILASYEILIKSYYPKDRAALGVLPLRMRYAGPREAVLHAIIRKNFGCTHFIVGRDHAGVGKYYDPFAAQEIFDQFSQDEIGIQILKYPEVVYCETCQRHMFPDECNHEIVSFSGTRLREYISTKEKPPSYLIRPEVFDFLATSYNSLVDSMYKAPNNKNQKGFVLWFTGLSQAGKTTIADEVYKQLQDQGYKVERLDGDVVREHLTKDLGFSKADRDENIRRVGFVAKLLSRNGVGVICSFISPYREQRKGVREQTENFSEVFCDCPLEICEKRDTKGLYQKARTGEIANFTGVSDPYEAPESPELVLRTNEESVQENAKKVVNYVRGKGLI